MSEMGPRVRSTSRMRALGGIEIGSRELEMTMEREIPRGRGESRSHGLSSPMELMGLVGWVNFGSGMGWFWSSG